MVATQLTSGPLLGLVLSLGPAPPAAPTVAPSPSTEARDAPAPAPSSTYEFSTEVPAPAYTPDPFAMTAPPKSGMGLIMGGSLLTGIGSGLMITMGVLLVSDPASRDSGVLVGGVMAGSAALLGGGVVMDVYGFRRLDQALAWERQFGYETALSPGGMWAGSLAGGALTGHVFGLGTGIIHSAIYTARVRSSRSTMRRRWSLLRPSLSPIFSRGATGMSVRGRF